MPDDGAWAADPQPADGLHGRPAPVLHDVAADERARAAQPRLAVHRHGARRVVLAHPQKPGKETGIQN